jgi:formate/nitrite transporter
MEKRFLAPSETAKSIIISAETKASLSTVRLLILGIMAGAYIGLGAFASIVISQTLGNIDIGLKKFSSGAVFPVGLMLVVFSGSELFTGNNLMTMALMDKKISFKGLMRNWSLVYLGNFLGSIALAYLIYKSQLVSGPVLDTTLSVGVGKMSLSFQSAFIRGILCNILVVLAVWISASAQDIISRTFSLWFPVMLFVLCGFEHSIANMFFIPLAKFAGLKSLWLDIWISNLIPVTLGNIFGGAIIIPAVYYITYIVPAKEK